MESSCTAPHSRNSTFAPSPVAPHGDGPRHRGPQRPVDSARRRIGAYETRLARTRIASLSGGRQEEDPATCVHSGVDAVERDHPVGAALVRGPGARVIDQQNDASRGGDRKKKVRPVCNARAVIDEWRNPRDKGGRRQVVTALAGQVAQRETTHSSYTASSAAAAAPSPSLPTPAAVGHIESLEMRFKRIINPSRPGMRPLVGLPLFISHRPAGRISREASMRRIHELTTRYVRCQAGGHRSSGDGTFHPGGGSGPPANIRVRNWTRPAAQGRVWVVNRTG